MAAISGLLHHQTACQDVHILLEVVRAVVTGAGLQSFTVSDIIISMWRQSSHCSRPGIERDTVTAEQLVRLVAANKTPSAPGKILPRTGKTELSCGATKP